MRRRGLLGGLLSAPWWLGGLAARSARAQSVDLTTLALRRDAGSLVVDFSARLRLSRPIEDALQRGLPLYFVAQAELYRRRWYWRDERLARVQRSWRLAFQPLTATWRVGLGALTQTYDSLADALSALSAAGGWTVAPLSDLDPDAGHYVDFSYRLDTEQLPRPMQLSLGGQADWELRIERTLPVP
jgi:Domain of unknown function (DUF4390)